MRVHFSSVATVFVALLFVSGTVGCRSNGGDWYNPKTYSWTNPFAKDGSPSGNRSAAVAANPRPSVDSRPDVSPPPGGYSAGTADRTALNARTSGGFAPWEQQNPTVSHTPPPHMGGYSEPVLSSNPPNYAPHGNYAMSGNMVGSPQPQSMANTPYNTYNNALPNQYPQEMTGMGQQSSMPYGESSYVPTDYRQPNSSGFHNQIPQSTGTVEPHGGYGQFGPVTVPPTGYNHFEQPMQAPPSGFPMGDAGYHQPFQTGSY